METQLRVTKLALDLITPPHVVRQEILNFHMEVEKWVMHEGLNGIKRAKSLFDYALNFFLGQPQPDLPWIKKTESGQPRSIRHTLKWGKSNPKEALTLLRIFQLYEVEPTDAMCLEAMESITAPSTATNTPEYIDAILEEARTLAVDRLHVQPGSVPMFSQGPNGIAILNQYLDARAHHRYQTVDSLINFSNRVASHGIGMKTSQTMLDVLQTFTDFTDEELGCLVYLKEKGGKLRVIAQGDYLTQSVMKAIHDSINRVLRKIKSDCTFNQDEGKAWMVKATQTRKWMASYDLSSATDRLPVWLQAKVIDAVLPGELGKEWSELLTNRKFLYTLPSGATGYVKYSVGQPMGFYSSFAAFALLHHCVVRAAYKLAHKTMFLPRHSFYRILGDDMIITDKKAGEMYCKIITDIGGVVNYSKSRISTVPGITIAEFAKTWAINGVDITPSSLAALRTGLNQPMRLPQIIRNHEKILGKAIKTKKLKFILQKYWPREANTLMSLIPVPLKVGGFGKPNSLSLSATVGGENGHVFRLYLANKVFTITKTMMDISQDALDSKRDYKRNGLSPKEMRLSLAPLTRLIRDREAERGPSFSHQSRKMFTSWVMSEQVPIYTLTDWITNLTASVPLKMRESLPPSGLSWLDAVQKDKKMSFIAPLEDRALLGAIAREYVKSDNDKLD